MGWYWGVVFSERDGVKPDAGFIPRLFRAGLR